MWYNEPGSFNGDPFTNMLREEDEAEADAYEATLIEASHQHDMQVSAWDDHGQVYGMTTIDVNTL